MRVDRLGERGLIERISPILGGIEHDDCAVLDMGDEFLVASTDLLHREADYPPAASAWQIGWMSVAVNLSDLAAMGAEPLGLLLAVGLPPETELEFADHLFSGFADCASAFGTRVLGGDTDSCRELTVAGTALGRVEKGLILRRRGARPGDLLCTTGILGEAGIGLRILEEGGEVSHPMVRRLLEPQPRLSLGRALAGSGAVSSMMDNSDGLALSLFDMAGAGGVGFEVFAEKIPLPAGLDWQQSLFMAMEAGGDFELLFTVRPHMLSDAKKAAPFAVIGRVLESGIWLSQGGVRRPLPPHGFEHLKAAGG
ncbi:MAG: thiamine monophosphate kinase [Methanosaeta sp. PtaB.Bin039]|nr:MAG: thiamine monophosphate kinase [Methanosaeta sp. PtaB.Bin039]